MGTCFIAKFDGGALVKRKCGWGARTPKCKLPWGEQLHVRFRYGPTQAGTNKETEQPIIPGKSRPVFGTRSEFIEESTAKLELSSPHTQDDCIQRSNLHRSPGHIMA